MKKIKQLLALLMVVTMISVSASAVFAADDDVFFPRIMIQSVIEEQ